MKANKKIIIINQDSFTIYKVGKNEKFRIKQVGDKEFFTQKLFKYKETKGRLWWKKTNITEEWKVVDINAEEYFSRNIASYMSNINLFKTYNTLDEAKKWIEDYAKYPIYH